MLRPTLDLLSMKAFQPDIRNYRMPFAKREIGEPLLGIAIHRSGASLCCLHSQENADPELSRIHTVDDVDDEQLREEMVQYARKHYLRYALGLLSYDFTIELRKLEKVAPPEEATLLRQDPEAILGDDIEHGDQYSIIRQLTDPGGGLVFAYKQAAIKRLENLTHRTPLSFLQIGGGVEWTLSHWLANAPENSGTRPLDLVLYDYPTITILQIDQGVFSPNIFCRTDSTGAPPQESPIVRKGIERYLRSGSRVIYIDLSLRYQGALATENELPGLLHDVVGNEDLTISPYLHPLQLLLAETGS